MFALRSKEEIAIVRVGDPVPVDIGDNEEIGDGKHTDGEAVNRNIDEKRRVSEEASLFNRILLHAVALGGFTGQAQRLEGQKEGGREERRVGG